jgi:K(+)-stimulated pyrophosphate-energized sodium pump
VTVQGLVIFFLAVSVLSLLVARLFSREAIGADPGSAAMQRFAGAIKLAAESFLRRQYRIALALLSLLLPAIAHAQPEHAGGGEANLVLPDLSTVHFFGMNGHSLLMIGLLFCAGGLLFGLAIYVQLKNLPVHRTMREISELIYETCKTYLVTQGKFIVLLWAFIAVIISLYFGWLSPVPGKSIAVTLPIILLFSLVGIAGSYGVAWFGIRVNTFANSRTAFAGLAGKPYPVYAILRHR